MDLHGLVARLKTHSTRVLWTLSSDDQVRQMSFGELHRGVAEAVRALQARGVSAGMRIGILAENCPEWIVHDLALITLGCTSVAFPRELAEEHWHELCDRFDLSLMLVSTEETLPLSALSGRVHVIDGATPSNAPALPPRRQHEAADFTPALAFSSGSTGKSKCMSINPAGIGFDIERFYGLYGITAADRLLVFLPFSHYQQRQCVYAAIWLGMDIALVRPQQLFAGLQRLAPTLCLAPPLLYETIYAQFHSRVDRLPAPARLAFRGLCATIRRLPEGRARRLVQRLAYGGVRKALGGSMRAMSTGMAPIKRDVLEFFLDVGVPVYEAYGTGETGLIAANAPGMNRPGSVGKLIAEGIAVLAEDGEIIVRDKELASRGYLDVDDGAARERFLSMDEVATGDIGRFDDDGFLYLIGRKKEIIITSSGLKIHPELVEARLTHHNLVERAAVFGSDMPFLVAVIVPRVPGPAAEAAIREHVQAVNKHLSTGTQVGRVIFSSESFTLENRLLTRTLKLNRPAIARRFAAEIQGSRARDARPGTAASTTDTERQLIAIWRDVLGHDDIGTDEHFLALGGNSLHAVQVMARIQDVFGVALPLRRLFEAATIAEIARHIDRARGAGTAARPAAAPIQRHETTREHPLSYAQQRMWLMQELAPESRAYHLAGAMELWGALDGEALRRAFLDVMARHDILRTRFPTRDEGTPVAVVEDRVDAPWELVDISTLADQAQEERVREIARERAGRRFDLERGPLVRVTLVRRRSDRHVLVLSMHHIASDGWSMGLLAREVSNAYRARAAGRSASPPALPIQYQDFARHQRAQVESGAMDAQRAFWREALAGAPEHLDLPYDRERPARPRSPGDIVDGHVPPAVRERLEALAREHESTLPIAMLALFQVLLHRYSGQEDVIVGVPVANRTVKDVEPLIGLFVNTLPHRVDLSAQPSFRAVLQRTRDSALDAFSNQELPLDLMVSDLGAARAHTHMPLFQALFVFQNAPAPAVALDGISISITELATGAAKLDLSLEVIEASDGGLDLRLEYDSEVFERSTIAGMMRAVERLATACVDTPERAVSRLSLIDDSLRQVVLVDWNRTETAYPLHLGLHQMIERQAAAAPDAVALRFEGGSMTYGEMDGKASALAGVLIERGVSPGQIVGVYLDRSMDMVIAILAVLKASAAYLPMDPANPPGRIAYMLEDARASIVLSQRRLLARLPAGITALDLDDMELAMVADAPPWRGTPDSTLALLYTSGSTGRPKGVEVHHRGICNYLCWRQSEMPMTSADRMLQKTSIGFDVACLELFQPLMNGAALVLCRPGAEMDADYLVDLITSESISFIHFVPSVLQVVLEGELERCSSLRYVACSGEALTRKLMLRCLKRLPSARLYNEYGPTECSVNCSFWPCTSSFAGPIPPIGRALANCALYVLDDDLQPVPPRVPGELYVGGVGLAHGYLHRDDLTRERFLANPFDQATGSRIYRTGDLVRYRNDGQLEFLGRRDSQVKLRGFRLELGEIEASLIRLAGVSEAVALVQGENDARRLVAFVVPEPGVALDEASLVRSLRADLPHYMVPSSIGFRDSLPRTSSGKLDRKALPRLDAASRAASATYVAPRRPLEQQIAELWRDVLEVEPIGVHDNFFELGGHSFTATQIVARLQSMLGGSIPLSIVFQAPTIAQLADALGSITATETSETPLTVVDRARPLPLSFAQERLWWESRQHPDIPLHSLPMIIRLGHECDIHALEHGVHELIRRHEPLRTRFPDHGGAPVQVIAAPDRPSIPFMDLSGLSPEQRASRVDETLSRVAMTPFDLRRDLPVRLALLKLDRADYMLVMVMHHIVTDGWSQEILAREFALLYQAVHHGQPGSLPELAHAHADFAVQQRAQAELGVFDAQVRYWQEQLRGRRSRIELPCKGPPRTLAGARCPVSIDRSLVDSAKTFSSEAGVTLFVTLLATFKAVLCRYSGQDDLCVGTPITGRHALESHGVVGLFINTLVLRSDLSGDPSFRELVARVSRTAIGAYANQDVPFERMAQEVWAGEGGDQEPLFNVMLILQNPQRGAHGDRIFTDFSKIHTGISVYDITLSLLDDGKGLSGWIDYRTESWDEAFIAGLMRDFVAALAMFTRAPDVRLSGLSPRRDALHRVARDEAAANIDGQVQA
jgi:amino acid adenylation domain-containing protein